MQNLLEDWLKPLSEAPFTMGVLNDFLKGYSQPSFKAHAMVKEGKLIRLKRGLFCVNPKYSQKSMILQIIQFLVNVRNFHGLSQNI